MSDLRLSGVRYELTRTLLHDLDLTFAAGRMTALSGPSGSGKTTLLSIAGGLLRPTAGEATYAGAPMWRGTGDPRPEVSFVLQVYGLVPILSARENVSVALRARGVDPDEADERAAQALARFHIADLADRQVEELSGGQMQRVALARGLCVEAGVLLADEPTSEPVHLPVTRSYPDPGNGSTGGSPVTPSHDTPSDPAPVVEQGGAPATSGRRDHPAETSDPVRSDLDQPGDDDPYELFRRPPGSP